MVYSDYSAKPLDTSKRKTHNEPVITKILGIRSNIVPCGRKRKKHKIATHKRKKRLRMNRHKKK